MFKFSKFISIFTESQTLCPRVPKLKTGVQLVSKTEKRVLTFYYMKYRKSMIKAVIHCHWNTSWEPWGSLAPTLWTTDLLYIYGDKLALLFLPVFGTLLHVCVRYCQLSGGGIVWNQRQGRILNAWHSHSNIARQHSLEMSEWFYSRELKR